MDINKVSSVASRVFTAAAVILFVAGVVEWILARLGVSLWLGYMPNRFLELAAYSLVPVTVLLLRQIRQDLRKEKSL